MKRHILLTIILFIFSQVSSKEPIKLFTGYYIKSLHINQKEQNAKIVFYFWLRTTLPKNETNYTELKNIEFLNADINEMTIHEERFINGEYYLSGMVVGDFQFNAEYKFYPFDKQKIKITMEHVNFEKSELIIVPDINSYTKSKIDINLRGVSKFLNSYDVIIEKTSFESIEKKYNTDFGDPKITSNSSTYSSMEYTLFVKRNFVPYAIKFMIPLIIVLCLSYLVFYIEADKLELASSLTVTALIAAIAFQWTISDDLPEIGYLTTVDKIYYLAYFLIMFAMVQTIWTYNLEKNNYKRLSHFLEIFSRWIFPISFCLGVYYFVSESFLQQ
jgi:hypothetical protein